MAERSLPSDVIASISQDPSVCEARSVLLERYVEGLLRQNQTLNLTAIRDEAEAWERHVVESLRLLPIIGNPRYLLDLGSGGGLPGLVLAIARPEIAVTLLEATGKKAVFLEATATDLGLSNVSVTSERAESAARAGAPSRERFDVVTARAVAPLRVLLEYSVPFAKVGGQIVAVKGGRAEAELADAARAMTQLHTKLVAVHRQPTATVLQLEKSAATPKQYPRRPGEPKRRPL